MVANRIAMLAIAIIASLSPRQGNSNTEPVVLRPDSDVAGYIELDPLPWGPNYANVDEEICDYLDSRNYRTTETYNADFYGLSDTGLGAGTTIKEVTLRTAVFCESPGGSFKGGVKIGSDLYYGTPIERGWGWYLLSWAWETNPNTGTAWTVAELDALQAGIAMRHDEGNYTKLTQLWVEVEYGAAPPEPEPTPTLEPVPAEPEPPVDPPLAPPSPEEEEQFVPEPASAILLLTGLGALAGFRKLKG